LPDFGLRLALSFVSGWVKKEGTLRLLPESLLRSKAD